MADQVSDPLDTTSTACLGGVALPGGSGNERAERAEVFNLTSSDASDDRWLGTSCGTEAVDDPGATTPSSTVKAERLPRAGTRHKDGSSLDGKKLHEDSGLGAISMIANSIESKKLHTDSPDAEELQDCGPRSSKRHQCSLDDEKLHGMKRLGSSLDHRQLNASSFDGTELQVSNWPGRPPGHMRDDDTKQEDDSSWPGRPPGTC